VHIDDYFYPYPVKAPPPIAAPTTATTTPAPLPPAATTASTTEVPPPDADFPDEPSWQRYRASGGKLARTDWRRDNVNQLVQAMYRAVRAEKAWVKVGISPFGLGRPDLRPAGIKGFSQYDKLYADVERWLAEGWLDYLVPQLYWPRAQAAQAFGPLLARWQQLNPQGRHLWPGLFTSKVTEKDDSWPVDEISAQVALSRELQAGGHVHFSMVALNQDRRGLVGHLQAQSYRAAALPPASGWLTDAAPGPLQLQRVRNLGGPARWALGLNDDDRPLRRWLWWREAGQWRGVLQGPQAFDWPERADALVASALSPTGIEGPRAAWVR